LEENASVIRQLTNDMRIFQHAFGATYLTNQSTLLHLVHNEVKQNHLLSIRTSYNRLDTESCCFLLSVNMLNCISQRTIRWSIELSDTRTTRLDRTTRVILTSTYISIVCSGLVAHVHMDGRELDHFATQTRAIESTGYLSYSVDCK
jgi:hypothetical protein